MTMDMVTNHVDDGGRRALRSIQEHTQNVTHLQKHFTNLDRDASTGPIPEGHMPITASPARERFLLAFVAVLFALVLVAIVCNGRGDHKNNNVFDKCIIKKVRYFMHKRVLFSGRIIHIAISYISSSPTIICCR